MPADRDEKTEPATPRKRQEARSKGQVARSQDLTSAVLMLAAFLSLYLLGPKIWLTLLAMTRYALSGDFLPKSENLLPYAGAMATGAFRLLVPFLIILFVALLVALLAQVGLLFSWDPVTPKLSRLNPISGIQRLFSLSSLMTAFTNIGKLLAISAVGYASMMGSAAAVLYAFTFGYSDLFRLGSSLVFDLSMRLGAAMLVLALLDLVWQRYKHQRDLRMTKEEVKDEMRNMDGDPQIRRRRREVQMQLSMARLRKEVPTADVVVTNPTHFAVAIKYDAEIMAAPKVVAKGADYAALRIRQLALEFGIPIVQRPPLARMLFADVEVGGLVPERLYRAIAEVLAYVYELTGRSPAAARKEMAGAV